MAGDFDFISIRLLAIDFLELGCHLVNVISKVLLVGVNIMELVDYTVYSIKSV